MRTYATTAPYGPRLVHKSAPAASRTHRSQPYTIADTRHSDKSQVERALWPTVSDAATPEAAAEARSEGSRTALAHTTRRHDKEGTENPSMLKPCFTTADASEPVAAHPRASVKNTRLGRQARWR